MQHVEVRSNLIVPNISWSFLYNHEEIALESQNTFYISIEDVVRGIQEGMITLN